MADKFNEMANRLRNSPWIWLFFLLFVMLFAVSLGLFIEDFTTSLYGYKEWPTARANEWVIYLVALLPQLGQVTFAYAYIDKRQPETLLILGLFFLWDLTTDVYYKSYHFQDGNITMLALLESLPLYTLGSEFLMAFSLGMIRSTWKYLKINAGHSSRSQPPPQMPPIPKGNIAPSRPPSQGHPGDPIFYTRPKKD